DLDGLVMLTHHAGALAEFLHRADTGAGGAEQVGFQDRDSGAGGVVGGDLADEQGNVDVRGTGLYAGGIETVEAAVGLERGFTVRHLRLDFTEAFAQRLEVWLRRAGG